MDIIGKFENDYILEKVLGEGTSSRVFLAKKDKQLFAIKVYKANYIESFSGMIASEVGIHQGLDNKFIIRLLNATASGKIELACGKELDNVVATVYEFAKGGNLADLAEGKKLSEKCLKKLFV